jgi:hypothetical protein
MRRAGRTSRGRQVHAVLALAFPWPGGDIAHTFGYLTVSVPFIPAASWPGTEQ